MQAVITKAQAKQITGGRTPLVPVEYENAVKALAECMSLDEAKYWATKSDALAAWAKIYRSDDAGRKARMLKLHAFRRMAELANELRPRQWRPAVDSRRGGSTQGGKSLLVEIGLKPAEAVSANYLAKLPKRKFSELLDRPVPPTPHSARMESAYSNSSETWFFLVRTVSLERFCTFCTEQSAKSIARRLRPEEAEKARASAIRISEWLDEFEQHLPKAK